MLEVRLRPGWVMVSAESGRLLDEPDQLAVDLASVRHDGNGVYTITTGTDETFRLIKRVGPVDPGVNLAYTVHLGDMPGYDGDFDGVPTVDLTLSDRMVNDEVAPMLARALAESTAVVRGGRATDGDRVFGPGGTPDVDAVQRPVDAGHRAELRQRGLLERRLGGTDFVRRTAVRKEIRKLALTMGVADGQPNAKLLRTLLTEDERAILDRAKDGGRPLEERVDQRGYLAKALGGSGVSSVVIGQPRPTACRHWGPRLSRSPTPARSCTSRSTATSQSPTATARAKPSQTSAGSTPPTADASSAA